MKALDLFCGAGGAGLGLERAGFEVLGLDNWNPAIQTHRKNGLAVLPRDLIAGPLAFGKRGVLDLLWASPPCQPFSVGGFGKGNADGRDGIPSTIVSIGYYLPNVFIIENVKGLTFQRHRKYLAGVVSELEQIGYQVEWKLLNAADYGVPQRRERVFIVGKRDGAITWPEPVSHRATVREVLPDIDKEVLPNTGANVKYVQRPNLRPSQYAGPLVNGGGRHVNLDAPAPTVRASVIGNGCLWVDQLGVMGQYHAGLMDGTVQPRQGVVEGARRLTEVELAALQGFPDGFVFCGNKDERVTQIGNAVPPAIAGALSSILV